jgi:hypothetical protein
MKAVTGDLTGSSMMTVTVGPPGDCPTSEHHLPLIEFRHLSLIHEVGIDFGTNRDLRRPTEDQHPGFWHELMVPFRARHHFSRSLGFQGVWWDTVISVFSTWRRRFTKSSWLPICPTTSSKSRRINVGSISAGIARLKASIVN